MNTLRQIYENMPDVISIPEEMRHKKAEVLIIPLEDENKEAKRNKRIPGIFQGRIIISDDFNEPIEDFGEYM